MKSLLLPFIFVSLLIAISCAKDEVYVREYPQVSSVNIKSNSQHGLLVEAELSDVKEEIIDVGFIWGKGNFSVDAASAAGTVVHLGKPTADAFSAEITSQLMNNGTYNMRAFASTKDFIAYSEMVTFKSQGSDGPVLQSVLPVSIALNDTIKIAGLQFGTDTTHIKVELKTTSVTYTLKKVSVTDTQIKVIAPAKIFVEGTLSVTRTGNDVKQWPTPLKSRLPVINRITSPDICSSLMFHGKDLLLLGVPKSIAANGHSITPLPVFTDSTFTLPVQYHISKLNLSVNYTNYSLPVTLDDPAPQPTITSSVPAILPDSRIIVLEGNNLPACGGITLVASGAEDFHLNIVNITPTQLTVNAVGGSVCESFRVQVIFNGKQIFLSTPVAMKAFTITDLSLTQPLHSEPLNSITINGDHLTGVHTSFTGFNPFGPFGENAPDNTIETEGAMNDHQIVVQIPFPPPTWDISSNPDKTVTFMIKECQTVESFPFTYDIPDLTISDVTPLSSNDSDGDLVITGVNFSSHPYLEVQLIPVVNNGNGEIISLLPSQSTSTEVRISRSELHAHEGDWYVSIVSWGTVVTYSTPIHLDL